MGGGRPPVSAEPRAGAAGRPRRGQSVHLRLRPVPVGRGVLFPGEGRVSADPPRAGHAGEDPTLPSLEPSSALVLSLFAADWRHHARPIKTAAISIVCLLPSLWRLRTCTACAAPGSARPRRARTPRPCLPRGRTRATQTSSGCAWDAPMGGTAHTHHTPSPRHLAASGIIR